MKKVTLNISDRIMALRILDSFKGSMDALAHVLDDAKLLSVTEEEWEQAKRVKTPTTNPDGQPSETWAWDNEAGAQKEVELNDSTVDYIRDNIKQKDSAGELTLQDKDLIHLKEVLN